MAPSVVSFRRGIHGLIPDAWIVQPDQRLSGPPVVALHGITRNVDEIVSHLTPRATSMGRTLVVPHFSQVEWPRYQRAACRARADLALLRLIETLRREQMVAPGRFDLSGFSGGAQFAHRFAWLYPQTVGQLCVTAPGWWTFPDDTAAWPYGLAPQSGRLTPQSFQLKSNLRAFLDRRIVVCVGSEDIDRDPNLRQGTAIDAQQGDTRYVRAHRWVDTAKSRARALGLVPRISLRVLQGCGHSFVDCVTRAGLDRAFIPPTSRCSGRCQSCSCKTAPLAERILERKAA